MEKQLVEQLLSNGLSVKKIKAIVEKLDEDEPNHDLNKTTIANTCGLQLIKCGSCNKKFYEDKFMLNRLNKRYRSCIDCVTRQRKYRQKDNIINIDTNVKNDNGGNDNVLAILDKDYINIDDEVHDDIMIVKPSNDKPKQIKSKKEINNKDKDYIDIDDDIIIKPSNDKPSNDKPKQIKTKKKINSNNHIFSLLTTEPEIEPEEVGLKLFNLFN